MRARRDSPDAAGGRARTGASADPDGGIPEPRSPATATGRGDGPARPAGGSGRAPAPGEGSGLAPAPGKGSGLARLRGSGRAPAPGGEDRAFGARLTTPLLLGSLLNPLNTTMISTALVAIGGDFGIGAADTAWLISVLYPTCG